MPALSPIPTADHPAHVPASLAFDFNIYDLPATYGGRTHTYWHDVRDSYPPIFWTPHYGGHWVATRGDDIKHMLETYEAFSNRESFIPKGVIPPIIPPTLDPPAHTPVRALIQPFFSPKAVNHVQDKVREVAADIIDKLKAKGHCEFISEFAGVMPVTAFLTLMQLPVEDGPKLREWAEMGVPPTNPRVGEFWAHITQYVTQLIEARRAEPRDDLVSKVVHATLDGRPITDHEVLSICQVVIGGGLDTVVTMTSFMAWHLAEHPEDRRLLREHPELIPDAVEEFARRFGTTNIGREVNKDLTYKGITMRKGDMMCVCTPLYGLDDDIYADPLTVNLRRSPRARHMAFGSGVHNCAGAGLARREMAIFLEEWLKRIPDFHVKPGTTPEVTTGLVNSINGLYLQW